MATHSSILAGKIPWTEESGGLQSMGSQRVRHDWATKSSTQWEKMVFYHGVLSSQFAFPWLLMDWENTHVPAVFFYFSKNYYSRLLYNSVLVLILICRLIYISWIPILSQLCITILFTKFVFCLFTLFMCLFIHKSSYFECSQIYQSLLWVFYILFKKCILLRSWRFFPPFYLYVLKLISYI